MKPLRLLWCVNQYPQSLSWGFGTNLFVFSMVITHTALASRCLKYVVYVPKLTYQWITPSGDFESHTSFWSTFLSPWTVEEQQSSSKSVHILSWRKRDKTAEICSFPCHSEPNLWNRINKDYTWKKMENDKLTLTFLLCVITLVYGDAGVPVYRYETRDIFKNPDYTSVTNCGINTCKNYKAKCVEEDNCCLCRCNGKFSTYNQTEGRCTADKTLLSGMLCFGYIIVE